MPVRHQAWAGGGPRAAIHPPTRCQRCRCSARPPTIRNGRVRLWKAIVAASGSIIWMAPDRPRRDAASVRQVDEPGDPSDSRDDAQDDVAALAAAEPAFTRRQSQREGVSGGTLHLDAAPPPPTGILWSPPGPSASGAQGVRWAREVFHRDAHCTTCHQPSGTGTPGIYPPLNVPANPWLADDERMIKIVLKGLWGPNFRSAPRPTNGVPPDGWICGHADRRGRRPR